jgi:OFA family oxalate/formate antiporter-like MFS transporter
MLKLDNRWTILAASVLINLCNGVGYTWSVFIDPLHKHFGWSFEGLAFAFTLNMGIVSPVAFILSARLQAARGAKFAIVLGSLLNGLGLFLTGFVHSLPLLYLTYGLVTGFGFTIANGAVMSNIVKYFPDRKGLALGLVLAGLGSGATVLAPLAAAMIKSPAIGVIATFKLLGIALFLTAFACSFLIKNAPDGFAPPGGFAGPPGGPADKNWRAMLADADFYVIVLLFILASYTGVTIISSASPIGQAMYGLSPQTAAFCVSIVAMCNGLGRIAGGALNDRVGGANALTIIYLAMLATLAVLIAARTAQAYAAAMVVIGLCYGTCMVTFPAIISTRYGPKHFTANFGLTFVAYSVTAYLAPRAASGIRVAYGGDYTPAFCLAAAACILGLALTYLYRRAYAGTQQR